MPVSRVSAASELHRRPARLAYVPSCHPLLCSGVQAPSWCPCVESAQPSATWPRRPHGYGERTPKGTEWVWVTGQERKRASLFPWDYTSLDLRWTRCFFKMTNQFPRFLQLWDGSTPPSYTDRYLWSSNPSHPVPEGERRGTNPLCGAMLWSPRVWGCSFLAKQASSCSPVY